MKNYPTLGEIYEGNGNESEIVPLSDVNVKQLIGRHSKNGYVMLNAYCRRELLSDVQKLGYSYTLAYGGFIENQNSDKEENVYERSIIVYAEKRDGSAATPKERFDFAIAECKKFNQDSVLVKLPSKNPTYYKKDGSVDYEFSNVTFNDVAQQYFTDLHKNTERKIKPGLRATRFSFTECYIAPKPQCYSESHIRTLKGEKFLLK